MPQFFVSAATVKVVRAELLEIQTAYAKDYGIELALVRAISKKESNDWPFAFRYEPGLWKQPWFLTACDNFELDPTEWRVASSVGAMQVLVVNCYAQDFRGNVDALFGDITLSIAYGCGHLAGLLERYDGNVKDAVSAYNFGSATDKNYLDYTLPVMELYEKYKQEDA